jgi:NADPH2:quinone reductase
MKALLCTRHGTPDDLELADVPDPVATPGEAVVHIKAAALNFFDTLIIANKYQTKPPLPFSPAAEFAGTVESVGSDVSTVKVGDRVIGCLTHGQRVKKLQRPPASSSRYRMHLILTGQPAFASPMAQRFTR